MRQAGFLTALGEHLDVRQALVLTLCSRRAEASAPDYQHCASVEASADLGRGGHLHLSDGTARTRPKRAAYQSINSPDEEGGTSQ